MKHYGDPPLLIAEVKTFSPFGFKSEKSWDELFDIAVRYGDIISVHSDPRWGGSFWNIERAASALGSSKLLLAKGMHKSIEDIEDALQAGANLVLWVDSKPPPDQFAPVCIWEPLSLGDISIGSESHHKILWNQRDLKTGEPKDIDFNYLRKRFHGWLAQGSYIKDISDVHISADAILVGEHLPEFVEIWEKYKKSMEEDDW